LYFKIDPTLLFLSQQCPNFFTGNPDDEQNFSRKEPCDCPNFSLKIYGDSLAKCRRFAYYDHINEFYAIYDFEGKFLGFTPDSFRYRVNHPQILEEESNSYPMEGNLDNPFDWYDSATRSDSKYDYDFQNIDTFHTKMLDIDHYLPINAYGNRLEGFEWRNILKEDSLTFDKVKNYFPDSLYMEVLNHDTIEYHNFFAYELNIINAEKEEILAGFGHFGQLDLELEAQDEHQNWRRISMESFSDWCGVGQHGPFLPPMTITTLTFPFFKGDTETQFRFLLKIGKGTEEHEKDFYSPIFKGQINKAQLWRNPLFEAKEPLIPRIFEFYPRY
jgi:hypothetical protein